jgi:hypothetical protein
MYCTIQRALAVKRPSLALHWATWLFLRCFLQHALAGVIRANSSRQYLIGGGVAKFRSCDRKQTPINQRRGLASYIAVIRRYKYIHMEEMLGNIAGARQVFERWMKWEPDHNGWAAFIKVASLASLNNK